MRRAGERRKEVPLTPTTVISEHVMPIGISTASRTMSRRPKITPTMLSSEDWTLWQHWIGPVLHWLTGVDVGSSVMVTVVVSTLPHGVATARSGRARVAAMRVNFIVVRGLMMRCQSTGGKETARRSYSAWYPSGYCEGVHFAIRLR